jgi:hypothetical protein
MFLLWRNLTQSEIEEFAIQLWIYVDLVWGLHDLWHPEANTSNNKHNQHQPTQLSCSMSVSNYVPMRICMGIWWGDGQAGRWLGRSEAALCHFDLHCIFWCCIMLHYLVYWFYWIIQCNVVFSNVVQHCAGTMLWCVVLCNAITVLHCVVLCCLISCYIVLYCAVFYCRLFGIAVFRFFAVVWCRFVVLLL